MVSPGGNTQKGTGDTGTNDLEGSRFSMLRVRARHADTTVVRLPTEVNYGNASDLGARCEDLIKEGCGTPVPDASEVQYLDSSGVSMIITLFRALDNHGGTLRFAALSDHDARPAAAYPGLPGASRTGARSGVRAVLPST
ncbi:STAS domain-containing protein [Streptomyces sp. NPDC006654]|uniref:STAS domain-containing protein n=1 Tax=Streptomyces sp. NPDC006654 TaxID=3156897 RepID=UPI0033D9A539